MKHLVLAALVLVAPRPGTATPLRHSLHAGVARFTLDEPVQTGTIDVRPGYELGYRAVHDGMGIHVSWSRFTVAYRGRGRANDDVTLWEFGVQREFAAERESMRALLTPAFGIGTEHAYRDDLVHDGPVPFCVGCGDGPAGSRTYAVVEVSSALDWRAADRIAFRLGARAGRLFGRDSRDADGANPPKLTWTYGLYLGLVYGE